MLTLRNKDEQNGVPVQKATRAALIELLLRSLGRSPSTREVDMWLERMRQSGTSEHFIETLMRARPISGRKLIQSAYPPGHYFSPVVNPDLVHDYVAESRRAGIERGIPGITFPLEAMDAFWARQGGLIRATPFPESVKPEFRYSFRSGPYGHGDGTTLRAIIADRRPKRIIEIGSGYSTACMLDTLDELDLDTEVTCIEPYPKHLFSIMRPSDADRLVLVQGGVQAQALEQFAALEQNDILFIDSTHVLKTGSDVHYELFYILPVLRPGVIIHFHDCRWPFEYPDRHIFENNRSWNEIYAVRALLTFSTRFQIIFSPSYYAQQREQLVRSTFQPFLVNSGSALWLEVLDNGEPFGLDAVGGLPGFSSPKIPSQPGVRAVAESGAAQVNPQPHNKPMEVRVEDVVVPFNILQNGSGSVYFSLGVRKSGSTMLHQIAAALARQNQVNVVDFPDAFFRRGLVERSWARLNLEPLVRPGNLYNGFRSFPQKLAASSFYRESLKIFMPRDPRDAIVSQYFSDAYSHSLPQESNSTGRERFLEKRHLAQNMDIDEWVLQHAPALASAIETFEPVLADQRCLILPYESYVFEKRRLIDNILKHFGWSSGEQQIAALLQKIDVVPEKEDQKRFIRKAKPGDHRTKLKPTTIAEINRIFANAMHMFGYA